MPWKKDKEKDRKKVQKQPSFTLPKNPYRHRFGVSQHKGPMVGTWTALWTQEAQPRTHQRSPGKYPGLWNLNDRVVGNLDLGEISLWNKHQKVWRDILELIFLWLGCTHLIIS